MSVQSYELLTGVGQIYVAPTGEAMPDVDTTPAGNWELLGETIDGVTVTYSENVEEIMVDQETGPVKAIRTEETMVVATALAKGTLENLAHVLGATVATTAPGAGTVGTKEIPNYRGGAVAQLAFLFRGSSPYGATYPAQFEIPIGYFGGEVGMEFIKDGVAAIPCEFHALVDPSAASDDDKFGKYIAQNADAV